MNRRIRDIALGGLFVAMGTLVPMLFHMFGLGAIFLPMHLPVLLGGFFIAWPAALAVGVITPLVSSFLTGMPPIMPTGLLMTLELGVLAAAASLSYRRFGLPVFPSVLVAMVAARIAYALELFAAVPLLGLKLPPLAYLAATLGKSWLGIVLQLLVVPAVVIAISRHRGERQE